MPFDSAGIGTTQRRRAARAILADRCRADNNDRRTSPMLDARAILRSPFNGCSSANRKDLCDDTRPAGLVRRPTRLEGTALLGRSRLDTAPSAKADLATHIPVRHAHSAAPAGAAALADGARAAAPTYPSDPTYVPAPAGTTTEAIAVGSACGWWRVATDPDSDPDHGAHRGVSHSRRVGVQVRLGRQQQRG